MAQFMDIATQFVSFYNNLFDTNRDGFGPLYVDQSMLTIEKDQLMGGPSIIAKLKSLPKTRTQVKTMDAQPAFQDPMNAQSPMGVVVFVTGDVVLEGEMNPVKFSQVFHLRPHPQQAGMFFIYNQMFRLNWG
eukprot:Rmarinus@m.18862